MRTGVTVILADGRAVCAVDVRGGAPGTRETDALAPENLVDAVDAVVLSGGSVYGLAAADGVAAVLGARRATGYRGWRPRAPACRPRRSCRRRSSTTSPTAATRPGARRRPIASSAWRRCAAAGREFALGTAGAGLRRDGRAAEGRARLGLGGRRADGFTVGAIVAVNSFGSVDRAGRPQLLGRALRDRRASSAASARPGWSPRRTTGASPRARRPAGAPTPPSPAWPPTRR